MLLLVVTPWVLLLVALLLTRLAAGWFGFDRGTLSMRPSDYVRRQITVSVEELEPGLDVVLSQFPDSVVFASDYPHADGIFPGATKELLEAPALSDADRRRILVDNAVRLYAL